jgi:transcription elongation factor GreA
MPEPSTNNASPASGGAGQKIRQKLEAEIVTLERELHHELPKEIAKARAHGERQHLVGMRLQQLRKRLADLSLVNLSKIPRDRAGYGSRLTLLDTEKDAEIDYQLVTAEESDAGQGLISTTSPIGRALMGKQEGDVVEVRTPAGARTFEVVKLVTVHDG